MEIIALDKNLWLIKDTCNVYLVQEGCHALAIDFGSGAWLAELSALGIDTLDHVLLTHHHADQCAGLLQIPEQTWSIHAPAGEQSYLDPEALAQLHEKSWYGEGCPLSYAMLPRGIPDIQYDLQGFADFWWRERRIRCLHTPGHGPNAMTLVLDHEGKQLVFCGDAVHAGGTLLQPFHLEWDHWTGSGVLAAWEGIQRLRGIHVDLLCPSHGPVICTQPQQQLRQLSTRLLQWYRAKGQISPDEADRYLTPAWRKGDILCYLPHLYQFGANGYLLVSDTGEGLVIDPQLPDFPALERLLAVLPPIHITATTSSHYHYDHCNGIPALHARFGAESWLHPKVAKPLVTPRETVLPWQPDEPIIPDHLWPEFGVWQWHEYTFQVAHWPGQTWWHTGFMTQVDGQRVFFAGDSFQPASRWNGTGGFCAFNNSRFQEGFIPSTYLIQRWHPQVVAAGHGCCYYYAPVKFTKIRRWAVRTAEILTALCATGDLEKDYYRATEIYAAHITAPPGD